MKDVNSGDVYNYAIMSMTEKHLTLMYLERGNLLKFRKQTAANKVPVKKGRSPELSDKSIINPGAGLKRQNAEYRPLAKSLDVPELQQPRPLKIII